MIDEYDIRRVRDAASIVEVMSEWLTLKKCGSKYECLCPFHDDHHLGSFKINPRTNTYCCYSCNAWGDSIDFLEDYAGMTFTEAVYYLADKYGIHMQGKEEYNLTKKPVKCKPNIPPPSLPIFEFDKKYLYARRDLSNDNLYKWIVSLPWNEKQRSRIPGIMDAYFVGHSKDGRSIFWQIDELGRARTAKLMRYQPDGHRDKTKFSTTFLHAIFEKNGLYNEEKEKVNQTLFGMHLLDVSPTANVNIVESEKSALVAAIYFGEFKNDIWMASGGKKLINQEKMLPIIARHRNVSLYPDMDAIDEWRKIAQSLEYDKVKIQDRFIKNNHIEADGPKADIADIIVRILEKQRSMTTQTPAQIIEEMAKINPQLQNLIDKLGLEPVIK